jgi:hypothetical protein
MGELIELLFKAVAWLVMASVYALWHLIRLTVLALGYVINVTVQLVRQHNSGRYSSDRRNWWNGQKWVPALPTAMWIIRASTLAVVILGSPSPSPSPSPQVAHTVFDVAGTGSGSYEVGVSPLFYLTPGSDWDLFWSYACVSIVHVALNINVKDGDGSTPASGDWQGVHTTGNGGSGVMHAHDPGGHERVLRLSITGLDGATCHWTMKVTATSPTPPTRPAPTPSPIPSGGDFDPPDLI